MWKSFFESIQRLFQGSSALIEAPGQDKVGPDKVLQLEGESRLDWLERRIDALESLSAAYSETLITTSKVLISHSEAFDAASKTLKSHRDWLLATGFKLDELRVALGLPPVFVEGLKAHGVDTSSLEKPTDPGPSISSEVSLEELEAFQVFLNEAVEEGTQGSEVEDTAGVPSVQRYSFTQDAPKIESLSIPERALIDQFRGIQAEKSGKGLGGTPYIIYWSDTDEEQPTELMAGLIGRDLFGHSNPGMDGFGALKATQDLPS